MRRFAAVLLMCSAAALAPDTTQQLLVRRVCDLPSLQGVPPLLRRPLVRIAVTRGLPIIDSDDTLREHILAGRTNHPLFVERFAAALDSSMTLRVCSSTQQAAICHGVASVLLTPSEASQKFVRGIPSTAIGKTVEIAPALSNPEDRKDLARAINDAIDLPGMTEEQEQVMFEGLVDSLAGLLDSLIPPELREPLLRGSPAELEQVRKSLVQNLEPEVVKRLPTQFLVQVDRLHETLRVKRNSKLAELPEQITNVLVDNLLESIRENRPDVMLTTEERLQRLDSREAALEEERARVIAEADSIVSGLDAQLEALCEERRGMLLS